MIANDRVMFSGFCSFAIHVATHLGFSKAHILLLIGRLKPIMVSNQQLTRVRVLRDGLDRADKLCYQAFSESSAPGYGSADKAGKYCRGHGGTLMNLYTEELFTLAEELIGGLDVNYGIIGLNDKEEEGIFRWGDGTEVMYLKWSFGEPSISGFELDEDCVEMNMSDNGQWHDVNCHTVRNNDYAILCEKEESQDRVVLKVTHGHKCGNK